MIQCNESYLAGTQVQRAMDTRILREMAATEDRHVNLLTEIGELKRAAVAAIRAEAFAEAASVLTYPKEK